MVGGVGRASAPETTAIAVANRRAACHPWAGYRGAPGFRFDSAIGWTVINSWGWRGPEQTIPRDSGSERGPARRQRGILLLGLSRGGLPGGTLKRALELWTRPPGR